MTGEREQEPEYSLEDARGWPFLALRCSFDPESHYWKERINAGRRPPQGGTVQADRMIWSGADGATLVIALAPGDCVRHGILLRTGSKPHVSVGEHQLRLLPLKPIWRGLIANTSFYALVGWCGVMMVRWLRRHRRLLRVLPRVRVSDGVVSTMFGMRISVGGAQDRAGRMPCNKG